MIDFQHIVSTPQPEVPRRLLAELPEFTGKAMVLKGGPRAGKSTLQRHLMRQQELALYCNPEDTRLYGMTPADFPTLEAVIAEQMPDGGVLFLYELQEVGG